MEEKNRRIEEPTKERMKFNETEKNDKRTKRNTN